MGQLSLDPRHPLFKVQVVGVETAVFPFQDPPAIPIPPLGQSKRIFLGGKKMAYIPRVGTNFCPINTTVCNCIGSTVFLEEKINTRKTRNVMVRTRKSFGGYEIGDLSVNLRSSSLSFVGRRDGK